MRRVLAADAEDRVSSHYPPHCRVPAGPDYHAERSDHRIQSVLAQPPELRLNNPNMPLTSSSSPALPGVVVVNVACIVQRQGSLAFRGGMWRLVGELGMGREVCCYFW